MDLATATVIAAIIVGVFSLPSVLLGAWALHRLWPAVPSRPNQAAYEMAYRGRLRELAGRYAKSRRLIREGRAWLRAASYEHRRSSKAGSDDATDDIKSLVTSSATIDGDFHCDLHFLKRQISARIHSRLGDRPPTQTREVMNDAVRSAAFYQKVIPAQMRRLVMAQFIAAIVLAAGVALMLVAPVTWPALSAVPHDIIDPTFQLFIKVTYAAVTIGFLSSGIGILFVSR